MFNRLLTLFTIIGLSGCTIIPNKSLPRLKNLRDITEGSASYSAKFGTLMVKPDTLPIGPYYGYDNNSRLISTIYMIPLRKGKLADLSYLIPVRIINGRQVQDAVRGTPLPVDHIEIVLQKPNTWIHEPHYQFILWHISNENG